MKRVFIAVAVTILATTLAAQGDESLLPHVTVYGTAVTKVAPDQMVWQLTIQNKGSKLPAVAERHATIVEQVLGFLKQSGVKPADVQTAEMAFGENWEYKFSSRVREGYYASTAVSFRTSDLKSYKPLWLGLAEIPDVTVEGLSYDHAKRIDYQNETRREALLKAKEKAADLAKTLGSELGEPLLIEEDVTLENAWRLPAYNANRVANAGQEAEAAADLAPGRIPIRMRVKVSFRLIGPKS